AIRATQAETAANASADQARLNAQEAEHNARQARAEANAKAVALMAEQKARQDETRARQQAFAALRSLATDAYEDTVMKLLTDLDPPRQREEFQKLIAEVVVLAK